VVLHGFTTASTPYEAVVLTFSQWYMVLLYALFRRHGCIHIRTALERDDHPRRQTPAPSAPCAQLHRDFVSVLLFAAFMAMPVAVLFGGIK